MAMSCTVLSFFFSTSLSLLSSFFFSFSFFAPFLIPTFLIVFFHPSCLVFLSVTSHPLSYPLTLSSCLFPSLPPSLSQYLPPILPPTHSLSLPLSSLLPPSLLPHSIPLTHSHSLPPSLHPSHSHSLPPPIPLPSSREQELAVKAPLQWADEFSTASLSPEKRLRVRPALITALCAT